jgi:hypothetical protein
MKNEITKLKEAIKQDYIRWMTKDHTEELTGYFKEVAENLDDSIKITEGKKYIKIVNDRCVWGFIVKEDFKHFFKGDILKPAGFNAPTLNKARGNIFNMNNLSVRWTGANYLR